MKIHLFWIGAFSLISISGCASRQKTPETGTAAMLTLPNFCLARAMHASMAVPPVASDEEKKKDYFNNYFEAFLDAKEQKKYVACLEKDRSSDDYKKDHRQAKRWLKDSQAEADRYEAFFPPEKRIADVEETFADVSAKRGGRHVVITLRDGEKIASDSQFDKNPANEADADDLHNRIEALGKQIDAIDQPVGETDAQRRQRLGLAPRPAESAPTPK